jgi:hypothetical protein
VHGVKLDCCLPAQRPHDLLRTIDWLHATGHREVHLVARGWGAIPAAFAALLADGVVRVTLKHTLASYASVAETEEYAGPLSSHVPDALATFDLRDVYRALAAKQLALMEPPDGGTAPA